MPRFGQFPTTRLTRLRRHPVMRDLVKETRLHVDNLVQPIFIRHGQGIKRAVNSMPGVYQLSLDQLPEEIATITALGIRSVLLFGIPEQKDPHGCDSYSDQGIIASAIRVIKKAAPGLLVIADTCFCEYTSHGHCGVVPEGQQLLDNDKTLELLAQQAICQVKAGADIIAPSGSIDGMVKSIRAGLDQAGFHHTPILSYSVKYASHMYGPFREAAEGAPQFGDRHSYQSDHANGNEALRECELDLVEGADMLMVKPAHTYLDIIARVKQAFPAVPLGAYQVSGEYSMIKAAAEKGWLDERKTTLEVLTSIRRAGADFIITYFAKDAARWLQE